MNSEPAHQATPAELPWSLPSYAAPVAETHPDAVRAARFREIYAHHLPIVFKTARAFAYTKEDREDLVQEILIALWEAVEKFAARSKLSTYVYRVAYRRALNWKRGRRRYDNKLFLFEREQTGDFEPRHRDETETKIEWIYHALGTLKPIDRTVCLLLLDGRPYSEIAEILGVNEIAVGVRVHRCKQRLIALLAKEENAELCSRAAAN